MAATTVSCIQYLIGAFRSATTPSNVFRIHFRMLLWGLPRAELISSQYDEEHLMDQSSLRAPRQQLPKRQSPEKPACVPSVDPVSTMVQ